MLPCAVCQNRLLALPEGAALPADLRSHLADCARCAPYRARLGQLNDELRAVPVPPADERKFAFLESLTAVGPVIRTMPTVPARDGSLRDLLKRIRWQPVGGLAAAVAVGVGLWATVPGKRAAVAEVVPPKHELLQNVVKLDAELAKLKTPSERIPKLAEMAEALHTETEAVYRAARRNDEMRSLAKMYRAVIREGIVEQAKQYRQFEAVERKRVLTEVAVKLAASAARTNDLTRTAPKDAKDSLDDMYQAAESGRAELVKLAEGA